MTCFTRAQRVLSYHMMSTMEMYTFWLRVNRNHFLFCYTERERETNALSHAVLRIRIHFIRIRISLMAYRLNWDSYGDLNPDSG